ncbi:CidA/LrgA family protein [Paenibacillus abyssi]|uniref:CidA/LrgA family protein n=1 Tax=Paenibacillus abyssi TaxID=1340531 RepID=A0A917FI80_9BACL|nr:CidA/LrgA family protein [Paenibacillus abyssi]GGF86707.1 hypothetical protein GCM10010916_00030 [Paenibacillus abyssi]
MLGLAILLMFQFAGILLKEWLSLPIPANVIGMLLFTCSLFFGWVKLQWVEGAATFLIRHMMLFFLPYVVGTLVLSRYVETNKLLAVAFSLVASTIAVLLATGWVAKLLERKEAEANAGDR